MKPRHRLGELLVQQEIVSQETINDALRVQVSGTRRLGNILLRMGALTEDQLVDTLSQQLKTPLINIDETFSYDLKRLLPRYLCTKYGVLPLSLKKNNILLTAMADPSDQEAINDIEHYTGKVVEPCLAKQSDINFSISNKIPYSINDIFNPQANIRLMRIIAAATLFLVIVLGVSAYNYVQSARYGTMSHIAGSTLYKHYDLMIGLESSGKISLLGHGVFSDGYYSVTFANINTLKAFIDSRKNDFSAKQTKWLNWVLSEKLSHNS